MVHFAFLQKFDFLDHVMQKFARRTRQNYFFPRRASARRQTLAPPQYRQISSCFTASAFLFISSYSPLCRFLDVEHQQPRQGASTRRRSRLLLLSEYLYLWLPRKLFLSFLYFVQVGHDYGRFQPSRLVSNHSCTTTNYVGLKCQTLHSQDLLLKMYRYALRRR